MKRLCLSLVVVGAAALSTQTASAQWYIDDQAATAGESYARGMSDVISAQGQYNLQTSQAAINLSEARSKEIQNAQQYTEAYFQMRAANKAYRAQEAGPRVTSEQLFRLAKQDAPSRLSPSELDPVSGKLSWPAALKTDDFGKTRAEIDELYAKRAAGSVLSIDDRRKLSKACGDMTDALRAQIRDLPPPDYLSAKKFIESLAYEGEKPTG